MLTRLAVIAAMGSVMSGCEMHRIPGSNDRDPILRSVRGDMDGGIEGSFRRSAFAILHGKTGVAAAAVLTKASWTCRALRCTTWTGWRDPVIRVGVYPPGPRRDVLHHWTLDLPLGQILSPDDLITQHQFETRDAPGL